MSNDIDKKKFKQKFGQKLVKLADKLINKTDKEENQMIVKNINANKKKLKTNKKKRTLINGWSSQVIDVLI